MLSRIDGKTSWDLLREIGGLPAARVDACLERWISEGLLEVEGGPSAAEITPVDPGLDLTAELQREILAFETHIDGAYHEILGVQRDADAKAIKRAYFALSKKFHPDRYFRQKIGHFRERLERIFKRLAEAYELLSDPATRAEVERSLASAAPAEPSAAEPAESEAKRKRQTLERLRRRFRIPKELLAERKHKAGIFYEASRIAFEERRWLEAAASARLAVAFDPWEERYRSSFSEIQVQVYEFRAAELVKDLGDGADASALQQALRLTEEVVHYRPGDAALQHQAARLALELGELEKAREFAEAACEIEPESAAQQMTLCRVLRRSGELPAARVAFEAAEALDPRDPALAEERRALQRAMVRG